MKNNVDPINPVNLDPHHPTKRWALLALLASVLLSAFPAQAQKFVYFGLLSIAGNGANMSAA